MKDIENSKKESPMLGLTGMGGGVASLMWAGVAGGATLWMWGRNIGGSLGDNSSIDRSSPVQIGTDTNWGSPVEGVRVNQLGYNGSPGGQSTLQTKTDGTLWSWGNNQYGAQGQNNLEQYSSPTQVGTDTTWAMGLAGAGVGWGVKTDGTLWTWGQNYFGLLGLNQNGGSDYGYNVNISSPTQVGTDTNWKADNQSISLCTWAGGAVKTDGTLWMWGRQFDGMLGLNEGGASPAWMQDSRSSPTQVGTDTNWSKVIVGIDCSYAFKTDGSLWSWGRNNYGQLGLNQERGYNKSSPCQIGSAPSPWTELSNSYVTCLGVRADGTGWMWGYMDGGSPLSGWLSSPTQVPGTNWSSGYYDVRGANAIKTDGTLWGWGENQKGNAGTNNTTNYDDPTQVGSDTDWPTNAVIGGTWNTTQVIKGGD